MFSLFSVSSVFWIQCHHLHNHYNRLNLYNHLYKCYVVGRFIYLSMFISWSYNQNLTYYPLRVKMATGIAQKSYTALFPLWSLKKEILKALGRIMNIETEKKVNLYLSCFAWILKKLEILFSDRFMCDYKRMLQRHLIFKEIFLNIMLKSIDPSSNFKLSGRLFQV